MLPSDGFTPLHNQEPSDIHILIIEDNLLRSKIDRRDHRGTGLQGIGSLDRIAGP